MMRTIWLMLAVVCVFLLASSMVFGYECSGDPQACDCICEVDQFYDDVECYGTITSVCPNCGSCVMNGACYEAGEAHTSIKPSSQDDHDSWCGGGNGWVDLDSRNDGFPDQGSCNTSSFCDEAGLPWVTSGESGVGEYDQNTGSNFCGASGNQCCGDDAGEYYRRHVVGSTSYSTYACCSSSYDCVWSNGNCYGRNSRVSDDDYLCEDGVWNRCDTQCESGDGGFRCYFYEGSWEWRGYQLAEEGSDCNDGYDNDCDGNTDCADSGCSSSSYCCNANNCEVCSNQAQCQNYDNYNGGSNADCWWDSGDSKCYPDGEEWVGSPYYECQDTELTCYHSSSSSYCNYYPPDHGSHQSSWWSTSRCITSSQGCCYVFQFDEWTYNWVSHS